MMPRVKGGLTVTGRITGGWLIKDIGVAVPHGFAVYIPADLVYKSKDLWAGIQQGRVFPLTNTGMTIEAPAKSTKPVIEDPVRLQMENQQLRMDLERSEQRNLGLEKSIQGMQAQLASIERSLGQIGQTSIPSTGSTSTSAIGPNKAVGGEIPAFIPNGIKPDNAETSITLKPEVVKGSSVTDTVRALRRARGKKG